MSRANFWSLLNFVEKAVVHEQDLDVWEFGKGALSANYIFSTTTPRRPERVQTQVWVEGGINAGIVEKICLSGEERLFRRSGLTSRALKRSDNGGLSRKTESLMKSKVCRNPANRNEETPANFRVFILCFHLYLYQIAMKARAPSHVV